MKEKKESPTAPEGTTYTATKSKVEPAVSVKEFQKIMLAKDARPYIEQRLELLRAFRNKKLQELDTKILIATDSSNFALIEKLRVKRQKWRDVTEYYKGLLGTESSLKLSAGDPHLEFDFDLKKITAALED